MTISLDKALGIHGQMLELRAKRNELLAGNLANADTPGYKARDLSFEHLLQSSGKQLELQRSAEGHMPTRSEIGQADVQFRIPRQPSLDGNTVEPEVEQARFAENAMRYEASLMFLSRRVNGIKQALQRGGQ